MTDDLNQFITLKTYARAPGKRFDKKTGKTIYTKRGYEEVLREADRVCGSAPHVRDPQRAVHLYGIRPSQLANKLNELIKTSRDKRGWKLKSNLQVLIGGVVTYPIERSVVIRDQVSRDAYFKFERKVLEYLPMEFGRHLMCVVRHVDEKYLHLHFYVIPDFEGGECNLDAVHPAFKAEAAAVSKNDRTGLAWKIRQDAGKVALRAFQDRFFAKVSVDCDHARIGPNMPRLTPKEVQRKKQRKKEAELAEEAVKKVRAEVDRLRQESIELRRQTFEECEERKCATQLECAAMVRATQEKCLAIRTRMENLAEQLIASIRIADELGHKVPASVTNTADEALEFLNDESQFEP